MWHFPKHPIYFSCSKAHKLPPQLGRMPSAQVAVGPHTCSCEGRVDTWVEEPRLELRHCRGGELVGGLVAALVEERLGVEQGA